MKTLKTLFITIATILGLFILEAPAAHATVINVCRMATVANGQYDCTIVYSETAAKTQRQAYYQWMINQGYVAQFIMYDGINYTGDEALVYSGGPCTYNTNHSFNFDGAWNNKMSSESNATGWTNGSGCIIDLWQGFDPPYAGISTEFGPNSDSISDMGNWDNTVSSMQDKGH